MMTEDKWLTLVEDQVAGIFTLSCCMTLADVKGDSKWALVVADMRVESGEVYLRTFDGQSWRNVFRLPDLPSSVLELHLDSPEPGRKSVPAIAVAVGNTIFVYKALKPLCRYQLAPISALKEEEDVWVSLRNGTISASDAFHQLNKLRDEHSESALTRRSRLFLMTPTDELDYFARENASKPLFQTTSISCMTAMKTELKEEGSAEVVVVGTESKSVQVIDPVSGAIKAQHTVPDVPSSIAAHGTLRDKYRLFVSCRDGIIYIITKDFTDMVSVNPKDRPIVVLTTGKHLVVPCMDGVVYFFKGKNDEIQIHTESFVMCAEVIKYEATGLRAVVLALANKEVRVYKDEQMVDKFVMADVVTAMTYGRFDREEGALILLLRNGTVIVKLLKRRAKMVPMATEEKDVSLESVLPKRSPLFLDHIARERSSSIAMNSAIFENMARMKYEINKRYLETIKGTAAGSSIMHHVIITPQLFGTGPIFKLTVKVQNISSEEALVAHSLHIGVDQKVYSIQRPLIELPLITPGKQFTIERKIKFIGSISTEGEVQISLLKAGSSVPIAQVLATIPESDVAF